MSDFEIATIAWLIFHFVAFAAMIVKLNILSDKIDKIKEEIKNESSN